MWYLNHSVVFLSLLLCLILFLDDDYFRISLGEKMFGWVSRAMGGRWGKMAMENGGGHDLLLS